MNNKNGLVYIIIGLALIGIVSLLLRNPFALVKSFISLIIFGLILFLVINLFRRNRTNSNEMKKYNRALKQSRDRYQSGNLTNARRKRPSYLRVIDGNKGKKDDQATYK